MVHASATSEAEAVVCVHGVLDGVLDGVVDGLCLSRAYKLGKQRRSYNECELVVCKAGDLVGHRGAHTLTVVQTAQDMQDNGCENQVDICL